MNQANAMMEEIQEQSLLLEKLFRNREMLCRKFVRLYQSRRFKKIFFVGSGSPYYAGVSLCFAAEKLLGAEAEAVPAGIFHHFREFNRSGRFRPEEILLVCPAESGRSRGQVDAARRAAAEGITVMSTTLNPDGVLARTSDVVLAKPGKHEIVMASTKGQSMAMFMLLLNFLEAARLSGRIDEAEYERYNSACRELPANIGRIITDTVSWFTRQESRVMQAEKFFLLGYGANYGTVQEAALKFFECHGRPSVSLELEEALHGPMRALRKTDMIFLIAAEEGAQRERLLKLEQALAPYCDNRIIVQSAGRPCGTDALAVHGTDVEFVNAIEYLVPFQVLSCLIAERLGIDLSIPLVASLDTAMRPAYEEENK